MEAQQLYQMPSGMMPKVSRNETLYHMCFYGSIALFLLNVFYIYLLLFYIAEHDYSIITEYVAVILITLIAFGCFVALATLYTITLNEQAYHHLRPFNMIFVWAYLGCITLLSVWALIYSFSSENHKKLFWHLFWPAIGEYIVYYAVFHSFHHMHDVAMIPYMFLRSAAAAPYYYPRV